MRPFESLQWRTIKSRDEQAPNQTEKVKPTGVGPQRGMDVPPTILTGIPPPNVDPRLLIQIVKVVMEGMATSMTQIVPATQVPQATTGIIPTTNSVVSLIRLVKSMREMDCEPYLGE